jgi:hypothetical protein
MATYEPPIENLPIFDPSVFIVENVPLTYNEALGSFLAFPVAQGTEDLSIINVNGLATFNANETHNQIATFNNQIIINDVSNINTNLNGENIIVNDISNNIYCNIETSQITLYSPSVPNDNQVIIHPLHIIFGSPPINTLTPDSWSGNIVSLNTNANTTHYLGFFDNSASGSGRPQKCAGINCNPNTGNISATSFNGSLVGNASSSSSISLTSDNTSGAYFIPFSKTVSSTSVLYVDNSVTPLSYDPSLSRLACNQFSGDLLGNATTSTISTTTSSITTTNDNSNVLYNLVFCSGANTNSLLYVDSITGPLTYNPNTSDLSVTTINATTLNAVTVSAELRTSAGSSPNAGFIGTTLTVNCNNVTIRTSTIIFTGSTNTVTTLVLSSPRNSSIYYVGIRNNGTSGTSFLTGLGTNILTKYSSPVTIPSNTSALMSINILTINGVSTSVVGIDLLT